MTDVPRDFAPLDDQLATAILVVDDRRENLLALQAVLEPLGVPITPAESGEDALRRLLREEFAVILLDVQMPGLSGFATAELIKRHPRTAHIPIIFLTAFDERLDDAAQGYSSGAVDYIVKPFDPWALRSKVRVFLELHQKSALLRRQTVELEQHLSQLRTSRAALADAQRIAQLGSWELDVATGRLVGSEEFHRIFSHPIDKALPPATAVFSELSFGGGRAGVEDLLHTARPLVVEAQLTTVDHGARQLLINSEPIVNAQGQPSRVIGTVQDVTRQREAARALQEATTALEHERELVQRLQEAVAPSTLPHVPEFEIECRYQPAEPGFVGGDWYDTLELDDGSTLLAIGDVAGHGLSAAATMSQLRTALRVAAQHTSSPSALLANMSRFLETSIPDAFATMLVARLDQYSGDCVFASAGHLPPLVCGDSGVEFLPVAAGPPISAAVGRQFKEVTFTLPRDHCLLFYTDGLVERRGEVIDTGLARLKQAAGLRCADSTALADSVMHELFTDYRPTDDVAILIARRQPVTTDLDIEVPAQPRELASIRMRVRRWLNGLEVPDEKIADIVLAVSELASNSCLHAYPPLSSGTLHVGGSVEADTCRIVVHDNGRWRASSPSMGGRGLVLIRTLGFDLAVDREDTGTTAAISFSMPERELLASS